MRSIPQLLHAHPLLYVTVLVITGTFLTASSISAQTGTLFVEGDNVGIGTATPTTKLEIEDSSGNAMVLVDTSAAATSARTLFELRNAGGVQFFFRNTADNLTWQMSAFSSSLQLSQTGSAGPKFRILNSGGLQALKGSTQLMAMDGAGNMTLAGTLTQGSSREIKSGIEPVDGSTVLEKVAGLPIAEWSYSADTRGARHVGPMAEDFHHAFGFGADDEHVAPSDMAGVALASVQELNSRLEQETERRRELERKNDELEQRLAMLEATIAELSSDED